MHKLLSVKGKVVGLLFDFELTNEGPPFGGSTMEYQELFQEKFNIKILKNCYNSINPRSGQKSSTPTFAASSREGLGQNCMTL